MTYLISPLSTSPSPDQVTLGSCPLVQIDATRFYN
jgi:hypothetical protein